MKQQYGILLILFYFIIRIKLWNESKEFQGYQMQEVLISFDESPDLQKTNFRLWQEWVVLILMLLQTKAYPNLKKEVISYLKSDIEQNASDRSLKSSFSLKTKNGLKKSNRFTPNLNETDSEEQNKDISLREEVKRVSNVEIRQIHNKIPIEDIFVLNNILTQHYFFFKLSKQQRDSFIEQLKLYEVKKDKCVYEKQDPSDRLYIVKEGILQVQTFNPKAPKQMLQKNDCFGEMDLIFDLQRSQTVIAKENSKLWGLERWKLDEIKQSLVDQGASLAKMYLQKVSTFSCLSEEEIQMLSRKIYLLKFRPGKIIFTKGDPSHSLFIIISGEVQLKISSKNNLTIKAGEVFGEACLKLTPTPRAGTAISFTQCRCLVISSSDFTECLGGSNIQNVNHLSILKWAFKSSLQFKNDSSISLYKNVQKGKIVYFKDGQDIFQNNKTFPNYYLVCLEGKVNQFRAGFMINCIKSDTKQYTKLGDGNVFLMQIKRPKGLGKSLKIIRLQQNKQCDFRTPLSHIHKHEQFLYQNLQSFMQNLIMVRRIKSLEGGRGDLYNVLSRTDNRLYNIRCIKKIDVSDNRLVEKLIYQKDILMKARMCNFLSCLYKASHDQHYIYLIFKNYHSGSLEWLLEKHKYFSTEVIIHLVASLLVGVQYMHMTMKVVHRNVTLDNVFLDESGYFCIDNFQNAKLVSEKDYRTYTIVGTPHYFAPEMVDGKGYSFQVDYWALGVLLYRVIYGKYPFASSSTDPFDIFKHILKNNVEFNTKTKVNPDLLLLTRTLLSSNPNSRVNNSVNGLRSHSLFQEIDWQQFENKNIKLPFNIQIFGFKKVDKKYYEEGKNYFSNFISKQKKKLQNQKHMANFKSWDFHFD